jgi:hypothetical protein
MWNNSVVRIDPSTLRDQLQQLGGGAADAVRGERTANETEKAQGEAQFEPIDRLVLKRLRLTAAQEAAVSSISFADAQELADRTARLLNANQTDARIAQGTPARDRLRDVLGE